MASMIEIILSAKDKTVSGFASARKRISDFASANVAAFKQAANVVAGFAKAIAAVGATVGGAVATVVGYYSKQQKAETDIASALRAHGSAVDDVLPKMLALASAIQDETGAADEATLALMAKIKNLGIADDKMAEATRGALGLAKALGVDQASAARYAALALNGEFTTLQRYIPALREAATDGEKMAIVQELMARGYEQQRESLDTVTGRFAELKGRVGDFLEAIGGAITNSSGFEGVLASLSERIKEVHGRFSDWVNNGGMNRLIASVKVFAAEAVNNFMNMKDAAVGTGKIVLDSFMSPFRYIGNIIGANINAWVEQFKYLADVVKEAFAKVSDPFGHDFTMPSAQPMKSATSLAMASFTDLGAFDKVADDYNEMVGAISEREGQHRDVLRKIQDDYEAAETKRLDDARKKSLDTAAAVVQAESDLSEAAADSVAEVENKNDAENVEDKLDKTIDAVEDVAEREAELDAENVEAKKQAELEAVREVADARAVMMTDSGVGAVDPANRSYNLTAVQMARDLAEAQAESFGNVMRDVLTETNEPIVDRLDRIAEAAERTAEQIEDAITMS
jgi:hypothetical protein